MNAYELADELKNKPLAYGNDIQEWLIDAANMLRQQAEQLKEKDVCLKLLADRIAELEKQIKDSLEIGIAEGFVRANQQSEPVAWIACDADLPLKEDGSYWLYPANPSKNKRMYIPLYTTPQTKLLSDEEIEQLYKETHFSETIGDCDYVDFARAIEAKVRREK